MSRPVVSAEDVRAAARSGEPRIVVPSDAIVTPLARDEAARRGIELVEGEREAPTPASSTTAPGAAGPRSHSATCNPDDVERIVERVRARMPGADASQVRDIARRLLERLGG
ncbi:MAG TPA: hypothetical protein VFH82_02170 [Gemmatimonadota bacterium]|nr:hypothetical protein [Gemmatimonadota bacterium]